MQKPYSPPEVSFPCLLIVTFLTSFALLAMTAEVGAADIEPPFHVKYRHENMASDTVSLSGALILNIYNTSGEDVQDIVAMIPGPNSVTYDNRRIFVGTVKDGQQVEILDRFVVPQEFVDPELPQEEVSWQLEFTNTLGARITLDVVGQKVE